LKRKSQQDKNRKRKNPFSWPEIFHLNFRLLNKPSVPLNRDLSGLIKIRICFSAG
jgi:hypothetical protein